MTTVSAEERAARANLNEQLLAAGHYIDSGVPGVFGHGAAFERIVEGFDRLVSSIAAQDGAEIICFPPVMNREILRATGYMENFPHLCGSVHSFCGDDRAHLALQQRVSRGEAWDELLTPTQVTLAPAGCYPLYSTLTGVLPSGGRAFDLRAWVFRHEPSDDPARLQIFRMHENVRVGAADDVHAWRERCRARGLELLMGLGLQARMEVASDPFFGRGGRLMKATQQEQRLKFEILTPICSASHPTAVASFNYHQDRFAQPFEILTEDGGVAHTACLGFGSERVAVALLKTHGMDVEAWPDDVRNQVFDG